MQNGGMRAATLSLLLFAVLTGCATTPSSSPTSASTEGFDPELSTYAYPFTVRDFTFESQRQPLRMAYMDERPAQWNGRTVLLLHGKNFGGYAWAETMRALLERGCRVVAPDQVCFGKSTKPSSYQFSFAQLATNTGALLDAIGVDRVSVVGHSMGGMLATRFALMFPERTEKLVLVNPIGLEDYDDLVAWRSIDAWYQQELEATPETIREYQRQSYYAGEWKPEYEALIEAAAGWTKHPDYPRVAWCSALTYDMIFTQPVVDDLPLVKTPTLLIIGQRDRTAVGRPWAKKVIAAPMGNYPELGRKAAAAIPHATLKELEGVGHVPQIEAFDTYMQALAAFLDDRS